ncbi:hypothetical protein [Bradyrhizobium pachyrhizi]|uniref:hypothetical protein n=1 Tax=Bradyrhizobium pachyrhizi TaxID=280333 RepID=UPI003D35DC24
MSGANEADLDHRRNAETEASSDRRQPRGDPVEYPGGVQDDHGAIITSTMISSKA